GGRRLTVKQGRGRSGRCGQGDQPVTQGLESNWIACHQTLDDRLQCIAMLVRTHDNFCNAAVRVFGTPLIGIGSSSWRSTTASFRRRKRRARDWPTYFEQLQRLLGLALVETPQFIELRDATALTRAIR